MHPDRRIGIIEPLQVKKIEITNAKDFSQQNYPHIHWLIKDFFEKGTMNMISAAPNNYKSWLALDIAISLASGSALFDYFMINDLQKVWIINEEDTKSGIQERMYKINKDWPNLPIYFSIQNQILLNDATVQQIIEIADEEDIDFIVFDSLRSIHLAEENSATEMQKVMNHIKAITNCGITVLFTHHNRKKGIFSKGGGSEDSRGSNAINAAIHSHLTCEPKKEDGVEYLILNQVKLKGARKMEPLKLRIDLENGPFHYEGIQSEKITVHDKVVKKIIEILEENTPCGINIKGLISANVAGNRTLRDTLKQMVEMKSITEMTWNQVQLDGNLETTLYGAASNEKFYFLP